MTTRNRNGASRAWAALCARAMAALLLAGLATGAWALPPVANPETITLAFGGAATVLNGGATSVLTNDTDPEADPLTAVLVTGPSFGSLTLNANGTFVYTHNSTVNFTDSFIYRANDGGANSNTVTVSITIIPPGDAVAPTVTSVVVPANATYTPGQTLNFTVNFSEAVAVTGTPRLPITLDTGGAVFADYVSGSTGSALVFRFVVAPGQVDLTGIALGAALDLNGGTLRDAAANNAVLALNGVGATNGVLVDAVAPAAAALRPVPVGGTWGLVALAALLALAGSGFAGRSTGRGPLQKE